MEATTDKPNTDATGAIAPQANDPIHDIDAKTTILWLSFWVVLLAVGLYLLLIVFMHTLQAEREAIYEAPPSKELQDLLSQQESILQGKGIEGAGNGMTINEAVKAIAEGKRPAKHQ